MGWVKENRDDCKRATLLIEKQLETNLSLAEKTKLKFHLYGCSWCRMYQQQSESLHLVIANLLHRQFTKAKVMPENFKNKLKNLITDKLRED